MTEEILSASLVEYITKSIGAGASEGQIKNNLIAVGWSNEQIMEAYEQALINSGVPSPNPTRIRMASPVSNSTTVGSTAKDKKSSAGETAINLLSFILLAIVAVATGAIFYQVINKFFPDALAVSSSYANHFSTSAIHYATAVLVVAFPVYYVVMYYWFKGFRNNLDKTETGLSKFLTYLVLLITAVAILGDLIAAVYTFLQGELSVRFFLKTLVIIIIAGLIFGFYYLERKKVQYKKDIKRDFFKVFGLTATAFVLSGIIFGFFATGSPALERQRGFDNQREKDLGAIAGCIERYANEYKRLPTSMDELERGDKYTYCSAKKDPVSGGDYEYNVLNVTNQPGTNTEGLFELCAVFDLDSEESADSSKGYYSGNSAKWKKHSAGRSCAKSAIVI